MSELNFTKMSGAGNDFILIDKNLNSGIILSSEFIRTICNRHTGIGADGILLISDTDAADFEMQYFNSDGSSGMLCGNGARCSIWYAEISGRIKNKETKFIFSNKLFAGKIIDNELIEFNLDKPSKLKNNFVLKILNKKLKLSFIDTGAHHVVVDVDECIDKIPDLDNFDVSTFGRTIRNYKDFNPPGTNVNFISIKNNIINIRTYERGVEEETLACGTGSVASAIISFLNNKIKPPVKLKTKSGDVLVVDFKYHNKQFSGVTLTGPAKIVFNGKYKLNEE